MLLAAHPHGAVNREQLGRVGWVLFGRDSVQSAPLPELLLEFNALH